MKTQRQNRAMETVEKQTTFSHRSHSPYCCQQIMNKKQRPKYNHDRLHKIPCGSEPLLKWPPAMDSFRDKFTKDLLAAKPPSVKPQDYSAWTQSLALWLYDTSHISIEYGIQYDGVPIEQLSPGTRGIVLLLLYLAIDRYDRRPLIIDQPEENLDPKSVFDELVPHFRDARQRRQVIVVTHNANLVVNTDADQVIVANSTRTTGTGLPTISYETGGLENPHIRGAVCQILEGGERAFLERERRYRLHWGETMGLPANHN
jgi:hypothetical protein